MMQRFASQVVSTLCQILLLAGVCALTLSLPLEPATAQSSTKSTKSTKKAKAKPVKAKPETKAKVSESAATIASDETAPPVKKVSAEQVASTEQPSKTAAKDAKDPKAGGKDGKSGTDFKQMLTNKDDDKSPLYVKSDSLALNAKSRVFTYSGNVEVQKGDLRITCDNMIGTYDADNRLENVLCKDNVVITRGTELTANANRANYSIKKAIIELTEGPELARDGNVLSADKIMIYVDEDRSEAEGNVRVKVIKAENGVVPGGAPSAAVNPAVLAPATGLANPEPTRAQRTVFEPSVEPDDE